MGREGWEFDGQIGANMKETKIRKYKIENREMILEFERTMSPGLTVKNSSTRITSNARPRSTMAVTRSRT